MEGDCEMKPMKMKPGNQRVIPTDKGMIDAMMNEIIEGKDGFVIQNEQYAAIITRAQLKRLGRDVIKIAER